MTILLVIGIALLAFANGANDNFKGVATLWGTGRYSYWRLLNFATICSLAGSVVAIYLSAGLVKVFSGGKFLSTGATLDPTFAASVALGAAATVLIATWLGAPISTTHALTGSLVGAGAVLIGMGQVNWGAAAASIALPLLVSPLLAVAGTLGALPLLSRWIASRDCVCLTEVETPVLAAAGGDAGLVPRDGMMSSLSVSVGTAGECETGTEIAGWNTEKAIHWTSAGALSFCRTLNDTPKIAALLLTAKVLSPATGFIAVGAMMAVGGFAGAKSVARTMSQKVTKIAPVPGMTSNLVAALLAGVASRFGVPVSTTHVTMGGILGVGFQQREQTNWKLVTQIALAWIVTMPIGMVCGCIVELALSARH